MVQNRISFEEDANLSEPESQRTQDRGAGSAESDGGVLSQTNRPEELDIELWEPPNQGGSLLPILRDFAS